MRRGEFGRGGTENFGGGGSIAGGIIVTVIVRRRRHRKGKFTGAKTLSNQKQRAEVAG